MNECVSVSVHWTSSLEMNFNLKCIDTDMSKVPIEFIAISNKLMMKWMYVCFPSNARNTHLNWINWMQTIFYTEKRDWIMMNMVCRLKFFLLRNSLSFYYRIYAQQTKWKFLLLRTKRMNVRRTLAELSHLTTSFRRLQHFIETYGIIFRSTDI